MTDPQIIEMIKHHLVEEEGDEFNEDNWRLYIENQAMGQCQTIVHSILRKFSSKDVRAIIGTVSTDAFYHAEENKHLSEIGNHYWIEINGQYYDFAKGTISLYVHFDELEIYDPEVVDSSIYHKRDYYLF